MFNTNDWVIARDHRCDNYWFGRIGRYMLEHNLYEVIFIGNDRDYSYKEKIYTSRYFRGKYIVLDLPKIRDEKLNELING